MLTKWFQLQNKITNYGNKQQSEAIVFYNHAKIKK